MLKDKSAIVTGSTSGIGLAIARALAAQGCNIMLNGLGDAGETEEKRAALEKTYQVKVRYHGANMMLPDQITELVDCTERELGSVDIVVNNAGIQHVAPIEQFPVDKWETILAINLSSAFHTIRQALPKMRARGWGRIVNIASAHGLVASPYKSAYVAAKHGLVGLTKTVALEAADAGITCNAICPGWVRTPLVERQIEALAKRDGCSIEAAALNMLAEKHALTKFVELDHLGALVVYLCSDAASCITGTAMPIDGGWTAR